MIRRFHKCFLVIKRLNVAALFRIHSILKDPAKLSSVRERRGERERSEIVLNDLDSFLFSRISYFLLLFLFFPPSHIIRMCFFYVKNLYTRSKDWFYCLTLCRFALLLCEWDFFLLLLKNIAYLRRVKERKERMKNKHTLSTRHKEILTIKSRRGI